MVFQTSLPVGEQELKFHVPKHRTTGFRVWLNQMFQPHPAHSVSTICSIYFDTPSGESLEEKAQSDFAKTKYRVRWYADESGQPLDAPAFIEIKEKHGAARRKYRAKLPYSPAELAAAPLEDGMFADLFQRHKPANAPMPAPLLRPVLELRYLRHRYVHPVFTETFCLDADIRCTRTRAGVFPVAHSLLLPHDVFEQKGESTQPLPVLRALPRFDSRRASFSKFHEVYLHLFPHQVHA